VGYILNVNYFERFKKIVRVIKFEVVTRIEIVTREGKLVLFNATCALNYYDFSEPKCN